MWKLINVFAIAFLLITCGEEEPNITPTGNQLNYDIFSIRDMSLSGEIVFSAMSDNSVNFEISINQGNQSGLSFEFIQGSSFANGNVLLQRNGDENVHNFTAAEFSAFDDLESIDASLIIRNSSGEIEFFAEIGVQGLTGEFFSYDFEGNEGFDYPGTCTIYKKINGFSLLVLDVENTVAGDIHPVHIHSGTVISGGPVDISLTSINGATGMSYSYINSSPSEAEVSYEDLKDYDGYITVHKSENDLSVFLIQFNIGKNELTGREMSYELIPTSPENVSGTVVFMERISGGIYSEIQLTNLDLPVNLPVHFHRNSAAEGGTVLYGLNDINNNTGISRTEIPSKDEGGPFTFDELANLDAYINVHKSQQEFSTFICQADIGGNELTGNSEELMMKPYPGQLSQGTAIIYERKNSNSLVEIKLTETTPGILHPSHIHQNAMAQGEGIIINLNNVDGDTGIGLTNVERLNSGENITWDQLTSFDGHIVVHKSLAEIATRISAAELGENKLTGNESMYNLQPNNGSAITGSIRLLERESGFTLMELQSEGLPSTFIVDIYEGSDLNAGDKVLTLGINYLSTNLSIAHIEDRDNETKITYTDIIESDLHIRIFDENGLLIGYSLIGSNG